MTMPGRKFSSAGGYRYGFNGQEKSDEIKGEGNSYTAEFWEYDPRVGRRWNVDPVTKEWESPYACFSNNPICNVDPDGDSDTTAINGVPVNRLNDGLKIANDYVKTLLKDKKVGKDLSDENKNNLAKLTYDYYKKHKDEMSFGDYLTMGSWVNKAFQSLDAIAWWRSSDFTNLNESLINNTKLSDASRIFKFVDESNKYANDRIGTLSCGAQAALIISSSALFPTVGKPPLSIPSLAARPIINSMGIKSATVGKLIGWGEGQGFMAVAKTRITTFFLTKETVHRVARMGMTKQWVEKQLASYTKSLLTKPNATINTQIFARKALMEKILRLW
jgi:RHS repeat-associated protein